MKHPVFISFTEVAYIHEFYVYFEILLKISKSKMVMLLFEHIHIIAYICHVIILNFNNSITAPYDNLV